MRVGSFSTPIPTVIEPEGEALYDREDSHHKTSQKAWKLHYRNSTILVNLSWNSSQDHFFFPPLDHKTPTLYISFLANCSRPPLPREVQLQIQIIIKSYIFSLNHFASHPRSHIWQQVLRTITQTENTELINIPSCAIYDTLNFTSIIGMKSFAEKLMTLVVPLHSALNYFAFR